MGRILSIPRSVRMQGLREQLDAAWSTTGP
jgi:hypothetical protein